jgi:hypothetical protein
MADDTDVLFEFCKAHWTEMHHIEAQRATITNIIIVITSVIVGFIVQQKASLGLLPVPILLVVLGLYGILITIKLYEGHHLAQIRCNHWYTRIDELHPNARFMQLRDAADAEHKSKYPRMSKFRLHWLWVALHAAIALLGVGITIFIVVRL